MKVGLVGLGKMGFNLALNLKDNGVEVKGFDVSEDARQEVEKHGISSVQQSLLKHWKHQELFG